MACNECSSKTEKDNGDEIKRRANIKLKKSVTEKDKKDSEEIQADNATDKQEKENSAKVINAQKLGSFMLDRQQKDDEEKYTESACETLEYTYEKLQEKSEEKDSSADNKFEKTEEIKDSPEKSAEEIAEDRKKEYSMVDTTNMLKVFDSNRVLSNNRIISEEEFDKTAEMYSREDMKKILDDIMTQKMGAVLNSFQEKEIKEEDILEEVKQQEEEAEKLRQETLKKEMQEKERIEAEIKAQQQKEENALKTLKINEKEISDTVSEEVPEICEKSFENTAVIQNKNGLNLKIIVIAALAAVIIVFILFKTGIMNFKIK